MKIAYAQTYAEEARFFDEEAASFVSEISATVAPVVLEISVNFRLRNDPSNGTALSFIQLNIFFNIAYR